jgi:hypothetical protein
MDLFSPIIYISIDGNKYGLIIIDDYSCFTWVFFLHDKSEMQEVLKKFLKRDQNEFYAKVKKIRSGNRTKFKNTQVEEYLDQEGMKHNFLAPYTPQQNGVTERKNRTLIESARTMLDQYKTFDHFLDEAINTTCHAVNQVAIVHDVTKEMIRTHLTLVHVFHTYASADILWMAHALSQCTLVRYGRIASISAIHGATHFGDSIRPVCISTYSNTCSFGPNRCKP